MTSAIDVSVIIAAWRAAPFIEKAINSALTSTGVAVEVIAVDDASPDETFAVLSRLADADARVTAIRLPQNGGPSAARNRAIDIARGRYIAILDADDVMLPGRLTELVALADRDNADIAVDNMKNVDEAGAELGENPFLRAAEFSNKRTINLSDWIRVKEVGYLKPIIRRSTLIESGVRYDLSLRNSEDYYLIADLLALRASMIYTPSTGYLYTRSTGSTSHRLKPEQTQAWLRAETQFAARNASRLTPDEQVVRAGRERSLRNMDRFVAIVHAMKSRKLLTTIKLLASDLQGASYTLGTLAKVAAGKVTGRKLV